MTDDPKVTPGQQRSLDGGQDAIIACDAEAASIGADGYGRDALEGLTVAPRLVAGEGGVHA